MSAQRINVLLSIVLSTLVFVFAWDATSARSEEGNSLDVLTSVVAVSDRDAEPIPHFPNRTAAFVWRNWNLTTLDALARTLETTPEKIELVAKALGLPEYKEPTWEPERVYITLSRRNWSILPYEQLLTLLNLTPEEYANKLREDDFLWVKMGAKPRCEYLRFEEPTEDDLAAMRAIAADVRSALGDDFDMASGEPPFEFLKEFEKVEPTSETVASDAAQGASQFELCYLHSYFALFGDPLLQDSSKMFPDALLQKLSQRGVNGVWFHAVLRELTPPTEDFPEFGARSDERRANLRELVNRAKKYGIDVYLYMNEPRAMPESFFANHPDERGIAEGAFCAMCASAPKVRRWLSDSLAFLFKDVPGLGGVFTITGSENLTTCASHNLQEKCPRCSQHSYEDLIADLNAAMEEGVHRSAPDAKVIVWDWGWHNHGMATDIIEKLPKNVWLQSVSEWDVPFDRGVPTKVGEYSISVVGPGPRAQAHWVAAKKAGLKTIAKCQFNTTWEIGSVPSIPALDLVARHAFNLSSAGVDGVMAGWSLGGYPSLNLEVVHEFAIDPNATVDSVLDKTALRYFGEKGAPLARKGWSIASTAFEEFPYGGSVMYQSPVHVGPANLLRLKPTGWRATMVGIPYDDVDSWRSLYPADVFANQLEKCGRGFLEGAKSLKEAATYAPDAGRVEAERQGRYAEYVGVVYSSVANQTRFITLRDERETYLAAESLNEEQKARLAVVESEMVAIARDEIELTKRALNAVMEDSRLGFESTCQYWFVANDLVEKLVSCFDIIRRLEK